MSGHAGGGRELPQFLQSRGRLAALGEPELPHAVWMARQQRSHGMDAVGDAGLGSRLRPGLSRAVVTVGSGTSRSTVLQASAAYLRPIVSPLATRTAAHAIVALHPRRLRPPWRR